jgi:Amt family ammonium transporter
MIVFTTEGNALTCPTMTLDIDNTNIFGNTDGDWIGLISGYVVVRGVELLDRLQVDDPVGAFPVHGACGVWGTLAVGIFGKQSLGLANNGLVYSGNPMQLGVQIIGSVSTVFFVLVSMWVVFKLIDVTVGLRVSREEELRGLDIGEHGMEAYGGFQIFTTS